MIAEAAVIEAPPRLFPTRGPLSYQQQLDRQREAMVRELSDLRSAVRRAEIDLRRAQEDRDRAQAELDEFDAGRRREAGR